MKTSLTFKKPFCVLNSALFVLGLSFALPQESEAFGKHGNDRAEVRDHNSDVANAWFQLSYDLVKISQLTPPPASRTFAYEGVALYEALVPGMRGYRSLAGQLNGLRHGPRIDRHRDYHWPSVANSALAEVMEGLYKDFPAALDSIGALHDEFEAQFVRETSRHLYKRSAHYGRAVGRHIYHWSKHDGFKTRSQSYTPCSEPSCWLPTPPAFLPALEPDWGNLRTFALEDGAEADRGPPPAYSEDPNSNFYVLATEVYDTVNQLTPEQRTIALFWADGPGVTGTPPGHSISLTRQFIEQEDFTLDVAAEAYAKVGIAVGDAFITCWWSKYQYNLLRPVTYIQRVIDGTWLSFIPTPNFPEHTSGHSTQSGAWAQVMTGTFGDIPFTDHTHDDRGFAPRSFNTFFEAAEEAAVSRLYGGIHYRTGNETGLAQGIFVGEKILSLRWRGH